MPPWAYIYEIDAMLISFGRKADERFIPRMPDLGGLQYCRTDRAIDLIPSEKKLWHIHGAAQSINFTMQNRLRINWNPRKIYPPGALLIGNVLPEDC
jgi:hypothetical protein